jgi:hypothetical protein
VTPAIATVVTARPWEPGLVELARTTGLARVIRRCLDVEDVDAVVGAIDAVVVGADTPWLGATLVRRWQRAGVMVVGMADPGDGPGRRLLERSGCDAIHSEADPPTTLLALVGAWAGERAPAPTPPPITVIGPRGAPGRSEVALGLAWMLAASGRTLLVELDGEAPSLGLRLGLPPATADCLTSRPWGPLEAMTVPLQPGPFPAALATRLVEAARSEFSHVVLDPGPGGGGGDPVVVCEPSPAGIIRVGRLFAGWEGPPPRLVVNRAPLDREGRQRALAGVRAASGLEPDAVLPFVHHLRWGCPPPPTMLEALRPLAERLGRRAEPVQRRAAR